jgi:hypothetical protein
MRAMRAAQSPVMLAHSGVLHTDAFASCKANHPNLAPHINRLN